MKTTMDMPDALVRQAKILAAREGTTFRAIMTRALEAELANDGTRGEQAPWRRHFGGVRELHEESVAIDTAIEDTFEVIDEEAWR